MKADPKNADLAMRSALRKVSTAMKTAAFRGLSQEFNLTQAVAKSKLRVPNPRPKISKTGQVFVSLTEFAGNRISLMYFKPTVRTVMSRIGRRKAVSIKVRKRDPRKTARHDREFAGFMGRGRAGLTVGAGALQIFRRYEKPVYRSRKDRHPIIKMDTKAPSLMLMSKTSAALMDKVMVDRMAKTFVAELNYYQNVRGIKK